MAPTAPPRFDAPIESPELIEHTPATPPAEIDESVAAQGGTLSSATPHSDDGVGGVPPDDNFEIVGRVERRPDGRPGWNTASLLDALVEMHNPTLENP
jgi:hypothetical protein